MLPNFPTCGHDGKPGQPYFCKTLTMNDIKQFHGYMYESKSKIDQDNLILNCCKGNKPKRGKSNHAQVSIQYNVRLKDGKLIRVCKNTFLGITNFSGDRVQRIVRNFVQKGELPKERRGGDRVCRKNDEKRKHIKNFIESLTCVECHYCRSKTSVRVYLPCDLNFKKLYTHYQQQIPNDLHVRISYFRKFLNANYNIAFGTPLTDCCSTCLRFKEQLKMTTSADKRNKLITENSVHLLKAKAFFRLLKHPKPNTVSFSFDCQKNLALPRLPDQAAYFSQQINYNNFTIVSGTSNTKLTPANVNAYLWMESDTQKNANTIASAVRHALNTKLFEPSVTKINLFADGCGGQNKNTTMMTMLAYWLLKESPESIKSIELTFPIVGHSFIPPDRVFGLIEKEIKKIPVIVESSHYDAIICKHATVRKIGVDWTIQDWKSEAKKIVKPPGAWHFKFSNAKRFIFLKKEDTVLIQGEINYLNNTGTPKGVCKKNCSLSSLQPGEVPLSNKLKGDKASIISLLAKHYGEDWRKLPELGFYKNILKQSAASTITSNDDEDLCENDTKII